MSEITTSQEVNQQLKLRFDQVRKQTLKLCDPLETEDFVVQPVTDVSPPKWHLAHTTWFFEVFLLVPGLKDYKLFHPDYPYLFNSYYVAAGDRWARAERGFLTRPTVKEVLAYRNYVEEHVVKLLEKKELDPELAHVMEIGLQHEQQHQELLVYDIKRILGFNPLFPAYRDDLPVPPKSKRRKEWLPVKEGVYEVGHQGDSFSFDNEHGRHKVYLHEYEISSALVTNGEYLEFIYDGGYEDHRLWLSDGRDWLEQQPERAPMYWIKEDEEWMHYTLGGLRPVDPNDPVMHISYYEADAFAKWKGTRLPTEFEWEVAAGLHQPKPLQDSNFVEKEFFKPINTEDPGFFGNLWEWTSSDYQPYPFYQAPDGALGEYNGKFMVNQKVLRGGSFATPENHIRLTYRNFFHPHLQWLFNGLRLARHK